MKVVAVTQARTGSTRLPGKVLRKIHGQTLLEIHLERIMRCSRVNEIVIATTNDEQDSEIVELCNHLNLPFYRGNEQDVLDRFYQSVKDMDATYVIRLTSDCPLIDPVLMDEVVAFTISNDLDYCTNTFIEHFPDGQDIEVFRFTALKEAWEKADKGYQREHVTPYIKENSSFMGGAAFRADNFAAEDNYGDVRMTVDEQKDLDVLIELIDHLGLDRQWKEYADHYRAMQHISQMNAHIKRNEGFKKD